MGYNEQMPPTVTGWILDKVDYAHFRWRVRPVLRRGRVGPLDGEAVAELCLRRALTMQREVRHASLLRQRESLAATTRAAVEAAIVGLYSLHTTDPQWVDRLGKATATHLDRSVTAFFRDPELPLITDLMADDLATVPGMHDLLTLAKRVDGLVAFKDEPVAEMLYGEYFQPLSNFSLHTGLSSLGRYYTFGSQRLRRRPWGVVPRRGLVRATDGSTALLAASIATKRGHNGGWFESYGLAQLKRSNRPFLVVALRMVLSPAMLRAIPSIIRATRRFQPLRRDPAFLEADTDERAEMLRAAVADLKMDDHVLTVMVAGLRAAELEGTLDLGGDGSAN